MSRLVVRTGRDHWTPPMPSGRTPEELRAGIVGMDDHRLDLARVILPKLFWSLAIIGVAVTVGIIAWHLGWFAWSLV